MAREKCGTHNGPSGNPLINVWDGVESIKRVILGETQGVSNKGTYVGYLDYFRPFALKQFCFFLLFTASFHHNGVF